MARTMTKADLMAGFKRAGVLAERLKYTHGVVATSTTAEVKKAAMDAPSQAGCLTVYGEVRERIELLRAYLRAGALPLKAEGIATSTETLFDLTVELEAMCTDEFGPQREAPRAWLHVWGGVGDTPWNREANHGEVAR